MERLRYFERGLGCEGGSILRICLMLAIALITVAMADATENASYDSGLQEYERISARDIQAKANDSSIIYDHIIIIGDLFLGNPQYNSIKITNSAIEGNVSCKGVTFYGDVDFGNTSFYKNAIFSETKFLAKADFNSSHFYQTASFNMSRFPEGGTFDFVYFDGLADFANVWFDKFATFYNATFSGYTQFPLSEFNGAYANFDFTHYIEDADFSGSRFNAYSTFERAKLKKSADFHATKFAAGGNFFDASFLKVANFARTHFIEDALFSGVYFNDTAQFMNAKFDGPAFFIDSRFCMDAVFDNAQFQAPADLSGARFDKDLSMNSTKITKMVLDESVFDPRSRLFLAKADINRLMVSWRLIKDILSFDTSAYLSLVKNYRDLGQSNDANDCYYEYRYLNQNRKDIGLSKLLDIIAWLTCGYGVRPHYALFCGLAVILLFSTFFMRGRGVHGFDDLSGWDLVASSLYYSTIAFTANSKGLPLKGHYKYLGIAEGIVGWLLMALFLVTLGRLMIG